MPRSHWAFETQFPSPRVWTRGRAAPGVGRRRRYRQLVLEQLEDRALLASSVAASAGIPEPLSAGLSASAASLVARAVQGETLRVIVEVREQAHQSVVSNQARGQGANILHQFERFPLVVMEVQANALQSLSQSPWVVGLFEDVADPPILNNSLPVIKANQVHTLGWDGSGLAVAILDTGIDREHPFFSGRVVEEACYSSPGTNRTSLCPNGTSAQTGAGAASISIAACLNGSSNLCTHGPHVAGIAAGDGAGVAGAPAAGVAPGADIIAIQVFTRFEDSTSCDGNAPCLLSYTSDQIRGLQRVLELSESYTIASANMSLGGGSHTSHCDSDSRKTTIDNLRAAGIATVVAAGNDGNTSAVNAPACISTAVAVGSTSNTDSISSFSNRGPLLDLFAPGQGIVSAVANNGFGTKSGTSMAAPHVAGAWAVLRQVNPDLSVSEILTLLQDNGKPITYSSGKIQVTTPRIDLLAAVQAELENVSSQGSLAVTTFADGIDANDGLLSLREAVIHANGNAGSFTILLEAGTYHLTSTGANENAASTGDLDVLANGAVTIMGAGSGQTIINAAGLGDRVFHVLAGAELTLDGVALTGGSAPSSESPTDRSGGGILNQGTVTVTNSTISGNSANQDGGGIHNSGGMLTVRNSTISGNVSARGGGVYTTDGTLAVTNSTLYGNTASSSGGGIHVASGSPLLHHTIVAGNQLGAASNDIAGTVAAASSYNLIGSGGSGGLVHGTGGNLVGIDPLLVLDPVLKHNGGRTPTHALIEDSLAVNAGDPDFDPVAFDPPLLYDQRGEGFARVLGSRIDIGAFELPPPPPSLDAALVDGPLTIASLAGSDVDHRLTVALRGAELVISDATRRFLSAPDGGWLDDNDRTLRIAMASITGSLHVALAGGDDLVTVDFAAGNPIPVGGLSYAGGGGRNELVLVGGVFHTSALTHLYAGDGTIVLDPDGLGGAAVRSIAYTGLELLASNNASEVVELNFTGEDEAISITAAGEDMTAVERTSGGITTFANPSQRLEIVAAGQTGLIDINSLAAAYASLVIRGNGVTDVVSFHGPLSFAAGHGLTVLDVATVNLTDPASRIATSEAGAVHVTVRQNIALESGSSITAVDGDIVLAANQQAEPAAGNAAPGLWLNGAAISASGAGSILLAGRGGDSGENSHGIFLQSGATVTGGLTGTVTLRGTGGAGPENGNDGVRISDQSALVSSGGAVLVEGTGGGGPSSVGIRLDSDGRITGTAGTPTVTLAADSINLTSANSMDVGGNTVVLRPLTGGMEIDLGGSGAAGALGLSDAELDLITAGTLVIGDSASGTLTVRGAITRPAPTHIELRSGAAIVFDSGSIDTAGGLLLASGTEVQPLTHGTDLAAGSVSFADGTQLAIRIDGTAADTGYSQLSVAGTLDLTGTGLALTGSHTPVIGDQYTVVNNVGTEPVIGTFAGLPEGAWIPDLLGSGRTAVISYEGGDGNDVVLTVDYLVGVQMVAVAAPSAPGADELPPLLQTPVLLGSTYYIEVWVQDRWEPGAGISEGKVDMAYTAAVADAVAVVNLDFDVLAGGTIDESDGVVRDLSGGTFEGGLGIAPRWARLGYVQVLATEVGESTFGLEPGSMPFSRYGAGNVDWSLVDLGHPVVVTQRLHFWQNPVSRWDVNADGIVTPLDALIVINEINHSGERDLPVPLAPPLPPPYFDVSGDDALSALDVLLVINYINAREAGPMPDASPASLPSAPADWTDGIQAEGESLPDPVPPTDAGHTPLGAAPCPADGEAASLVTGHRGRAQRPPARWEPLEDVFSLLAERMSDQLLDDLLEPRDALFALLGR